MGIMDINDIFNKIQSGQISAARAAKLINEMYERDLGFARVDLDRHKRCGLPEVIYCPGKTGRQITDIMAAMIKAGQNVLATRASAEQYKIVKKNHRKASYNTLAKTITLVKSRRPKANAQASAVSAAADMADKSPLRQGQIGVVCAGTSDIPVAEEAAVTAEFMGARVERIYDVGVAGLHRVFKHLPTLRESRALVVVAGMEGALPSVIGGLIDRPIIAVPTSVGYGTNLNGFAPLLAMLNSCVPGITVVNIDNGFSAGVAAAMICRIQESGDSSQ
ncbi:MAG: nickel pincer cofactor biosynthesis protein LarB [Kiritimatiellia bacterium]|nr:nickel pincer cofactor biosynthesis protein LarB [Kiritimatiellia bacterium]